MLIFDSVLLNFLYHQLISFNCCSFSNQLKVLQLIHLAKTCITIYFAYYLIPYFAIIEYHTGYFNREK
ncbi:hypothetical protein BpHYR1_037657 [Brachionus plicatilis]|uniref:Uncharacterized protein n=1 Tax=Brachionus plicatilis TaxID=10195 RepID=A0A3M7RPB7_BRAPC|nr:hypothetical protein BpHYR1_037657 [Brachionus plicatilis]